MVQKITPWGVIWGFPMSKDFRSENCSASAPFSQEPSLFYEAELQVVLNIVEKQTNVSGCV